MVASSLYQCPGKPRRNSQAVCAHAGWHSIIRPPRPCLNMPRGGVPLPTPLPDRKFLRFATGSAAYESLPRTAPTNSVINYLYEVYVDNYISIAIPTSQQQLDHFANTMGHGIHDVFPTASDPSNDPMAPKTMERGDCLYDTTKDILGFDFKDAQREFFLVTLASWSRRATLHRGTPWQEYTRVSLPRFATSSSASQRGKASCPLSTGFVKCNLPLPSSSLIGTNHCYLRFGNVGLSCAHPRRSQQAAANSS